MYLTYAAPRGHALIDRALYLPKSWTDDPGPCTASGVPADVGFATKPALAQRMINAALDGEVPDSWVAGTRSMTTTRNCAPRWSNGTSATCWPWPALTGSPPLPARPAPTVWPAVYPAAPGRCSRPGRAQRGRGCTPGRCSTFPSRGLVTGGCCCAATTPPKKWRTTGATRPTRCHCRSWSGGRAALAR